MLLLLSTVCVLTACQENGTGQNETSSVTPTPVAVIPASNTTDANGGGSLSPTAEEAKFASMDVNLYKASTTVCDPFNEPSSPAINGGLKADLYYLAPNQPRYSQVADYIDHGHKADQDLFFSALNVPTRKFDLGFSTETGGTVKTDTGENLIEWFALSFSTVFRLAPNQDEGLYELAVLSDDGAVVRIKDAQGVWTEIINNDGTHPTRMGCSTQYIQMSRNSEHAMEIDYYQGPRYHISLVMMMRKVGTNPTRDPLCGQLGNSLFFDYNNGSSPQPAYNALLNRGWKVLTKDNFSLPQQAFFNPCVQADPPVISGFHLVEASNTTLWVRWQTDRPSTSQVLVTHPATGQSTLTTADNALRTSHEVVVNNLAPMTTYNLQAVSITDDYGKATSAALSAMTEP